ncbi:MAG: DUF1579 family protein [Nitrospira sp.]|nr:DUF1579 domain-containing protein [Nitrospira sp.]
MRRSYATMLCLCAVLMAVPAPAKEQKSGKKMDDQAMMELWKQMATPGEPHKLLAGLAGRWTTKTKEWMEPASQRWNRTGPQRSKP